MQTSRDGNMSDRPIGIYDLTYLKFNLAELI